ncbi:GNAT family N-acetyltransferase [Dyadobacter sp. NIV53]|uniref:GNAT family N-acetyltransferase n=1 Tax=Dyadobacter sp. NIV53 TaxID=2861765 RepID=UPI001C873078|nr:GNAT family N-acetyltransferase [Dyadobacter sp. NIV53]
MTTEIRSVTIGEILGIRHQVLWAQKSPDFVKVPEDESGLHFGMFYNQELVSVISLFPDTDEGVRFRKFATMAAFQNKGLGSKLLEFVISYSRDHQHNRIWCDARTNALGFYERFGFSKFSDSFMKEEIEYYKIAKNL